MNNEERIELLERTINKLSEKCKVAKELIETQKEVVECYKMVILCQDTQLENYRSVKSAQTDCIGQLHDLIGGDNYETN